MGEQSEREAEIRDLWAQVDAGYEACVHHCLEMAELLKAGKQQYDITANAERRMTGFNAVMAAAKDKINPDLYRAYYTNSFRLADIIAGALTDFDSWSLAHNLGKTEPEVLALADLAKTEASAREIVLSKPDECFLDAMTRNLADLKRSQTES
jgi:hypothetical protein